MKLRLAFSRLITSPVLMVAAALAGAEAFRLPFSASAIESSNCNWQFLHINI
jgi:hypothetical protein